MAIARISSEVLGESFRVTDQALHSLAPPDLQATLKRAKMSRVVAMRIPALEGGQELSRGLIGVGFQTLKHFHPVSLERVGTATCAKFRRLSVAK